MKKDIIKMSFAVENFDAKAIKPIIDKMISDCRKELRETLDKKGRGYTQKAKKLQNRINALKKIRSRSFYIACSNKDIEDTMNDLSETESMDLGLQFYNHLLDQIASMPKSMRADSTEAKMIKDAFQTIENTNGKPIIPSIFERSIQGIILGFIAYYEDLGENMGEVKINEQHVDNPYAPLHPYTLDTCISYKDKLFDLEADGLHQGREEFDSRRDVAVKAAFAGKNVSIVRFREKGNQMLYTSECHSVSYVLTKENKRDIIHVLNNFYGFSNENTEDILHYISEDLRYEGRYLLYGKEIDYLYSHSYKDIRDMAFEKTLTLPEHEQN